MARRSTRTLALLTVAALDSTTEPITAFRTTPADPHAAARMAATVEADFAVDEPVVIDFSAPMDPASVAAATTVKPATATNAQWSADGRSLRLAPRRGWQPGTFYTVTVETSAQDAEGNGLAAPVRAIFLTRDRPAAALSLTRSIGRAAHPETAVAIRLSALVEAAAVARAFSVEPAVEGVPRRRVGDVVSPREVEYDHLALQPLDDRAADPRRPAGHERSHGTSTTLPTLRRSSTRRCACGASASGNVAPTRGRTAPEDQRSTTSPIASRTTSGRWRISRPR